MLSSRSGCSSTATSPSHGIGTSSRHARLLRQFNEDIFKRHVLTDVEVVVGGKVFKSHRAVLICFSPALKRKLLSDDGKPIATRVCIPRISNEEFEILLHYMYTGDLSVTCNNFYEIYRAASILEMQDVIQECMQIFDRPDDIRSYFYIYVTAKKMDSQRNWLRALRLLAHRFEESICDPEFLQMDLNYALELLSAQSIGARSEVLVFLAALNWLDFCYSERQEDAVKVMGCVRFSSMSMDEIVACYHPPFLPQLLEIPEIVMMLFRATCYITAKFLGQESWFRHFGCPKRNLAFENLPMELWHKKEPPNISNADFAMNWQNSLQTEIPEDIHNSQDSKTDVNSILYDHKAQDFERPQHPPRNRSPREAEESPISRLSERAESASHLAEAVEKVLEQSAQTSRDEINVAEVVKRVLGEINTRRDQREESAGENRYRLPQEKVKNDAKQKQTNVISSFGNPSHYFPNSSESGILKEQRQDPDRYFQNSPHHPLKGRTRHPQKNPKHDQISTASMVSKANFPCLIKGSKIRKHPEVTINAKDEYVKSDTNEHSKEGTDSGKGKEFTFLTAVKEESRSLQDQSGKVTNVRLNHDPPQAKAHLAKLEEHSPGEALVMQESSVDIYEEENPTSRVDVALESSPQKTKKENVAILVTGGMNPNSLNKIGVGGSILNYDPKEDKWTRYGTLPSPRHNHSAVFWDNCLYIIGGGNPLETLQQKCYVAKKSCYKLDLNKLQWSVVQDMKFRRYDHGSVVLDGQIYAIGGQDNGDRLLKTIEVYDTKTGKWKVLPSELCCGRKAIGTVIFDGKIWIAGGLMQADKEITQQIVAHVDCYDPKQKRWTFNVCSLPTPQCYCSLAVWNDRIYCVGGLILESREKMRPTKEVWIFNDKAQTWEKGPSLPVPRMNCSALVHDNILYVIGGFDPESDVAIKNVNFLSPAATCWEVAASLPSHLFGMAAVAVLRMD